MLLSVAETAVLLNVPEKAALQCPRVRTAFQRQEPQSEIPAALRLMESEAGSSSP